MLQLHCFEYFYLSVPNVHMLHNTVHIADTLYIFSKAMVYFQYSDGIKEVKLLVYNTLIHI
jgi:hypothetical protein